MLTDILIIGGGVIGTAIARELSRYTTSITLIERNADVGFETSSRNSGVLHSGIHYKPGTLRAFHAVRGNILATALCRELSVPFSPIGKLTIAQTAEEEQALKTLLTQGTVNGVEGLEILPHDRMTEKQPGISGLSALYSPSTGIINPYEYTIALAESAYHNGVQFLFCHEALSCSYTPEATATPPGNAALPIRKDYPWVTRVQVLKEAQNRSNSNTAQQKVIHSKLVIICAGLHASKLVNTTGLEAPAVYTCKGEYSVLDIEAGKQIHILMYPVPGAHSSGLGIHVTPTVDGNVLLGPSNEYIEEPDNQATTRELLLTLQKEGRKLLPTLAEIPIIRNFTGVRPKLAPPEEGGFRDFIVEAPDSHPGLIYLTGIESPGLTAAASLALTTAELAEKYIPLTPKENFITGRPWLPDSDLIPAGKHCTEMPEVIQEQLIQRDPRYGTIICRCESITKAEIVHAIERIFGPVTFAGIKYRSRAGMGRCQGGFCTPRLAQLLEEEFSIPAEQQLYKAPGTPFFAGPVRTPESKGLFPEIKHQTEVSHEPL